MSIELSLYKIADAFQLPLSYKDGKVSGQRVANWNCLGVALEFTVEATKLFSGEQIGVLVHVMGDLYTIVAHYPKTGSVSAYLIDGSKLEMDGVKSPPDLFISKKMTLREVVDALRSSIVGAYYWKNDQWKALRLPD